MQVDLIISYQTLSGKKQSTTISDANPNVENEKLRLLAVALNEFTTNMYKGATKETKEGL